MTNTQIYQRRDYFRQTISFHVVPLSRDYYMASTLFLQSQLSFYSFAQLHFVLKICTTVSPYKKVSITTVSLSLPSCKQLLLPLEKKKAFISNKSQMKYSRLFEEVINTGFCCLFFLKFYFLRPSFCSKKEKIGQFNLSFN